MTSAGNGTSGARRGPLEGITVVDLTSTFMGPYCSELMAQMGADVIKVEPPGGDVVRGIGDDAGIGMGPIFVIANRGKRSVALDLKSEAGRAALLRIASTADVLLHNMRPDAIERLGFGYEHIRQHNPDIVYCAMIGYGSAGPYRDRPAYDDVIQACSGLAAVQGGTGDPAYVKSPVADKAVALFGLSAVVAALYERTVTGAGQAVEVPMFEAMTSFNLLEQQGGHVYDPPRGHHGYARTASPHRKPYRTADGHLSVLIYTDRQWAAFFELIGQPELAHEPRYRSIGDRTSNIDELYQLVERELAGATSARWLAVFERRGIPCVPVNTVPDLLDDEHLREVGFFETTESSGETLRVPRLPVTFSGSRRAELRPAPNLGEHTEEVLRGSGVSAEDMAQLDRDGSTTEPGETR